MEIKVGDATYTAEFNGFTPIAYSRCFHVEKQNGTRRPKDIIEAVGLIAETMTTYGIPSIEPLLEIFYACIKTSDPKFPTQFNDWVSSFPADAYDMGRADGWAADVMSGLIEPNFFPSPADGVDAAPAGKADTAAAKQS